jgi:hypothetical protein
MPSNFEGYLEYTRNNFCRLNGGASRDRTDDPLRARQMLSQLSYGPALLEAMYCLQLVGLGGVEPPTSPLSGVRSNQLSYRPFHRTHLRLLQSLKSNFAAICVDTYAIR